MAVMSNCASLCFHRYVQTRQYSCVQKNCGFLLASKTPTWPTKVRTWQRLCVHLLTHVHCQTEQNSYLSRNVNEKVTDIWSTKSNRVSNPRATGLWHRSRRCTSTFASRAFQMMGIIWCQNTGQRLSYLLYRSPDRLLTNYGYWLLAHKINC
jgi:argonaute-like protein implicated in RNA metabolism and viral defense